MSRRADKPIGRAARRSTVRDDHDPVVGAATGQSWATSPATRRSMQANRRRDTGPELAIRRLVHARGLRYRVDARPLPSGRHTANMVFTRARVAVFIDGCWWHGCPEHYRPPASNARYWAAKVSRNRERDRLANEVLTAAGWAVIRAWEHEAPEALARRIEAAVRDRVATDHRQCAAIERTLLRVQVLGGFGRMSDVKQRSAPLAVEPFYSCARANQPIGLFRGGVDLVGNGSTEHHRGGIVLDWLPSPILNTWVRGRTSELALHSMMGTDQVDIVPRTPPKSVPGQSPTARAGRRGGATSFEIESPLLSCECGDATAAMSHALFHAANFPRLHGRPVTWSDGSVGSARLMFEGSSWTIVMDEVQNASELGKNLKAYGGFALTHVARVHRTDGSPFTSAELQEFVDAFTFFCWLCAEARCGPLLPVGFDGQGHAVWSRWSHTRTESFSAAATWLDTANAGEAEALFPTLMARFGDRYWRQILTHAIAYLVEAGRPHTVERAIMMAQLLLEAVGYSWLVEERKLLTHDGFEKRKAAQNIRKMLLDMKVPTPIPKNLSALSTTRSKKGDPVGGPGALVIKRNEIAHRRGATPNLNYAPLIEAWRLGAWYSELAVLRLCGFNGLYRSRLSDGVWTGAVERVPWQ